MAHGDTREEAARQIQLALAGALEAAAERGVKPPAAPDVTCNAFNESRREADAFPGVTIQRFTIRRCNGVTLQRREAPRSSNTSQVTCQRLRERLGPRPGSKSLENGIDGQWANRSSCNHLQTPNDSTDPTFTRRIFTRRDHYRSD